MIESRTTTPPTSPGAPPTDSTSWHTLEIEQVLQRLKVDPTKGLTDTEITARLEQYGANELEEKAGESIFAMLFEQLIDPMVLVLLGAATISFFLGDTKSVFAIMAIVVLNALIGVSQEYRAEQAMAALKKMAAPSVRVRRNGQEVDIASPDLVPGDVVLLEAGSVVPADGRIIESASLQIQESSLTGESVPVEKSTRLVASPDAPVGDRTNLVYMGTAVTNGRSTVVTVNTGMQTELGRIASLIQEVEGDKTPLQKRMAELGKALFYLAFGIVGVALVIGLLDWQPDETLADIFIAAVAMAVAVIPEGMPAVVTIALALGAQRMLRRKALIRKLPAVETLGSVTVICSDKTGTLTENKMTVTVVDIANYTRNVNELRTDDSGKRIFRSENGKLAPAYVSGAIVMTAASLANDATITKDTGGKLQTVGDPTETALLVTAASYDTWKPDLERILPRVSEVPFSSERKRMSTIHRISESPRLRADTTDLVEFLPTTIDGISYQYVVFAKGAVDSLLEVSNRLLVEGEIVPMSDEWRRRIEMQNNTLAGQGLRVLGFAFRLINDVPEEEAVATVENELIFSGIVGMIDPPRNEVKDAVQRCLQAGIRPIMITGDHPLTAFTIARQLKIVEDREHINVMEMILTGRQLTAMSDEALEKAVERVSVYARVSPEHKLRIVRALQKNGEIVSMTGDGVNDAPALKQADIGVAMGITGTAVAKEASDMVILDDNFATIVSAAEEGRTIYDNVRKFIKYILGSNIGEVGVLFVTQLMGLPLPVNTLQILWMNLVTDGLPALALSVEQGELNSMNRPPRNPKSSVFSDGLGIYLPRAGLIIFILGLGMALLFPRDNVQLWSTMVFTTLVIAQMGHALAIRSERNPIWKVGYFSNPAMIGAIALTAGLQLVLIYVPFMNDFFHTTPLTLEQLALCYSSAVITYIYIEIDKWLFGWRKK
ncbi:MAG TPA: cation-translocating P-type ATPase [Phototrophicaceae bacterium]|jgi:Ca2+-transporting ATPase|nr:cation-translocating P-type ATPase [Phototrophicaceae bacterium]